jgi:[ribosomal protein S5]-alanine N-acetyltransferase
MISERLIFKKIKKTDKKRYISQVMTDSIMRYITGGGLSSDSAEKRFEEALTLSSTHKDYGIFTVWLKSTHKYIGLARLKLDDSGDVEIGYNLLEQYWGKAYGTEIGAALMAFLIEKSDKQNVYAIIEPENKASVQIIEKLGLKKTEEKASPIAWIWRLELKK